MELTLLGTGCPQVSTQRYGPSSLVQYKGSAVLVDCGSGATQRLLAAGCTGRHIDALLLTHLHSDHTMDLFQLVISAWHQGRDRPHLVIGPPGTRRFVDALLAAWAPDIEQRVAFERRASTLGLQVDVREIGAEGGGGDVVWTDSGGAGLAVRAVKVSHEPVTYAYGFVFEAGGRLLAFSGDTAPCPALAEAARGADVLVHECFVRAAARGGPGSTPETMRNVASYHTPETEVGKVAAVAEARCLVLQHFVPAEGFDKAALVAEVRRDYGGAVVVGEDLMRFSISAGQIHHAGAIIGLPGWDASPAAAAS